MVSHAQDCRGAFGDNPIIYHLITDRFARAEATPAVVHQGVDSIGTFHGGNLAGVLQKLESGWFTRLGVNGILISAPYQQIMGWIPGANGEFRHYAYHGYYALDYTILDARFGTDEQLKSLIAAAHTLGIKVLFDIVMNHPGYPDIETLQALSIDAVRPGASDVRPDNYADYFDRDSAAWRDWWGSDWVRDDLAGYSPGGTDDWTMQLAGLPDFRTENPAAVALPTFLKRKADTRAVELPETSVRAYLIAWLTGWVREYGVDGFRCDSARHVEPDAWFELKQAAQAAYEAWRAEQGVGGDSAFWMTGEVFGQGVEQSYYFDFGFDNLINFQFQEWLQKGGALDEVYGDYAGILQGRPGYNVLSYISSHDTCLFDRDGLMEAGSALLLAPGGVLIYYGDETARPAGPCTPSDPTQATRSDMNWDSIDHRVLEHWSRLGQFRARHVALARGAHYPIQETPYVFGRRDPVSGDVVVAGPALTGPVRIPVADFFLEGELVRDAYSGQCAVVEHGMVCLDAAGTILIERAPRL